ncbi:MAG: glycerol kinase GlpK [Pseudomonadota bacterium]|nr:glycerol kinase GlpK [Pseudomonadota bacterium]
MAKYILAIDQGTTGTTVSLVSAEGQIVSRHKEEFPQIYPQPGWVEHNSNDIWKSALTSISKVLTNASASGSDIAAVGITNQRETVLIWNRKTGAPIHNAIVWQCRRTSEFCNGLKKRKLEKTIYEKTGLVVDAYFSGSKINWLLKNVSGAQGQLKRGDLAAGTIDTFLMWKLSQGEVFKTDVSNASRTQLMNIDKCEWDVEMLRIFGVPKEILPQICSSNEIFGHTKGLGVLPDGIPISGVAGDQQAALFGQTCFNPGEAKCTFGTGSFLLINSGNKPKLSKSKLLTTVAWRLKDEKKTTYALEGGAFICGAAVQWMRDGLKAISRSSEIEQLANSVADTGGVEFVPALTGLGAPHWDQDARGLICGLTRGTTSAHLARATLEAMALQNTEILIAMQKDLSTALKSLRVDGGAASNNLLMQTQSDYLGVEILRPEIIETTSAGAAYLAGLGIGFWNGLNDIKKIWKVEREFKPKISSRDRRVRLEKWTLAVKRARL